MHHGLWGNRRPCVHLIVVGVSLSITIQQIGGEQNEQDCRPSVTLYSLAYLGALATIPTARRRPEVTDHLSGPRRIYCFRKNRFDSNYLWAVSSILKVSSKRRNRMVWSTVSKAADRSRRTRTANSPPSTVCKISDSTRRTEVLIECPCRNPDRRGGMRGVDDRYQRLQTGSEGPEQATHHDFISSGVVLLCVCLSDYFYN